MEAYGDYFARDVYNRHKYSANKPTSNTVQAKIDDIYYAVAAPGSSKTEDTQSELMKISAVQSTADNYTSRMDVNVNSGATASVDSLVASLSKLQSTFASTTITQDVGSNYTSSLTKGVARDNTTAATVQTFTTGASNTSVSIAASSDRLNLKASTLEATGTVVFGGNMTNFTQSGGTAGYKQSTAGSQYVYTHNAGTTGTSTGVTKYSLDGFNVDGLPMASGAFSYNSFNSTGAQEEVLRINGGAAAGQQTVAFTNSIVGVGQQPVAGQALSVLGNATITGSQTVTQDLSVLGNLNVTGTVNHVNSTEIDVVDKSITLASNTTDPSTFNGGGLLLGTTGNANQKSFLYNNTLGAWESNINENLLATKSYMINGLVNTTTQTGMNLSETALSFGSNAASMNFGTGMTFNQNLLQFASSDAQIKIGVAPNTITTIDKNGVTTNSDNAAVFFGSAKEWRIKIEIVNSMKMLAFQYCGDGSGNYVTKQLMSSGY